MTELKTATKKAQNFIRSYDFHMTKNKGASLYEIYNNFSDKKQKAFEYCCELLKTKEGFNPCFCGHNYNVFTYAFLFIANNKTYLCYITPSYNYVMEYDR